MAASVRTGCTIIRYRHRLDDAMIAAHAMTSAQPKCNDGIAANWLANPLYGLPAPYDAGPKMRAVSTKPNRGSIRGGASGNSRWTLIPTTVIATITLRKRRYPSGWRT